MDYLIKNPINYEVKMLEKSKIDGLVPTSYVFVSDSLKMILDEGVISFKSAFDKVDDKLFARFIIAIRALSKSLPEYLLSLDKISLILDDIYLDRSGEIRFLYMPKADADDFKKSFLVFLDDLSKIAEPELALDIQYKMNLIIEGSEFSKEEVLDVFEVLE